ncbi:MAG: hypothetical protein U5N55_06960 [Cypionkella sp.]|nr:hypothetical protein [Cypionkella sp.]
MDYVIWVGAAITVLGMAGLIYSALLVIRARKSGLDDTGLRAAMQRALVWNVGALALSGLGLMMVVVGVLLD